MMRLTRDFLKSGVRQACGIAGGRECVGAHVTQKAVAPSQQVAAVAAVIRAFVVVSAVSERGSGSLTGSCGS